MQESLASYFAERLDAARNFTQIDWLGYFQVSRKQAMATLLAYAGTAPSYRQFSLGFGPIGRCAADGAAQTSEGGSGSALSEGEGIVSQLVQPVSFAGEIYGALDAESRSRGVGTDPARGEALTALASQLAVVAAQPVPEYAVVLDREIEALHRKNSHYHWVGVYKLVKDTLYLASFRGAPSPHSVIPRAQGICGAAVRENQTLNIPDVTKDERYLSCDTRTRSEIVVPIRNDDGEPVGEIDIDSHLLDAFGPEDSVRLEAIARELAPLIVNLN